MLHALPLIVAITKNAIWKIQPHPTVSLPWRHHQAEVLRYEITRMTEELQTYQDLRGKALFNAFSCPWAVLFT